jgi:protein O-mannosyl-transferase
VLHVVTLRIHTIACDRFLYVPVAVLCAIAAARAASIRWSRPAMLALTGVCVCVLVAFPAATLARNASWADDLALWAAEAHHASPLDGVIPSEYGNALFRAQQPERALAQFRESLVRFGRFEPHSPLFAQFGRRSARTNIAAVLSELGEYAEAQRILEAVIAEEPTVALHRFNLGVMAARRLEFEMAQRSLEEALRLHPDYPAAQRALGLVREARDAWRELPPERDAEPTAVRGARAALFAQLGRWHDAERAWSEVALAPDATRAQLEGAALYLARHAHPDTAVTAIARFEARYGASPEAAALRQLVAGRRDAVR